MLLLGAFFVGNALEATVGSSISVILNLFQDLVQRKDRS